MNLNALNDGTRSGTLSNLAQYLRFLASASENPEICDPGLHQAILIASQTARELEQKDTVQAVEILES
ncbi:hypothetical protein [Vibrio parahaemolyticus]|uniref:hypothetical protein n=1 Tax=Vibrio parahaemolyticus TaxID=670 RepID=UPI00193E73DB|nr:hypothetical protein [Vibrio parahaemolyticus]HAS6087781.1 hypothetical protein [Vibrio vulnificus]MBM5036709.1 hypothetical protein [Vibrio parahaemolyticus]MBM5050389.1 hypothetical protein [Vibrio parahaemolyticus]MBM5077835.1 hypothetical protein [Vibrio parahaemolyticus]HCG9453644.1 hypothetical protein [Vibrio parahaemolyticus]